MAVQFHTEGLRQPMLIGKDVAGNRIPGGPYVVWQAAALLMAPVAWNTADLWGHNLGPLGRVLGTGLATGALFWLLGRIDFAGRNPLWVLTGLITALALMLRPATGRMYGQPLRVRRHKNNNSAYPLILTTECRRPVAALPSDRTAPPDPASPPQQPSPDSTGTTADVGSATTPITHRTPEPRPTGSDQTRKTPLELFLAAAQPGKTKDL